MAGQCLPLWSLLALPPSFKLALIIAIYRNRHTVDVTEVDELKL